MLFDLHWRYAARFIVVIAVPVTAQAAMAQETTTYTYDALGRVTGVVHIGGPANGTSSTYTYDPASNRTNVTVSGSPNGNANSATSDNGASAPATIYVVVPLNGFTVIPVTR